MFLAPNLCTGSAGAIEGKHLFIHGSFPYSGETSFIGLYCKRLLGLYYIRWMTSKRCCHALCCWYIWTFHRSMLEQHKMIWGGAWYNMIDWSCFVIRKLWRMSLHHKGKDSVKDAYGVVFFTRWSRHIIICDIFQKLPKLHTVLSAKAYMYVIFWIAKICYHWNAFI